MEDILEIERRRKEEADKKALIEALKLFAASYDKVTYRNYEYDAFICPGLHEGAKLAVEGKVLEPAKLNFISTLHKKGVLENYIKELRESGKLDEVDSVVLDAILNASDNAKKHVVATPSAVVNYRANTSLPFRFFDPKKDKLALGVAVTAGALGVGGLVTAFTFIGLAATTISTSTAAMVAVGAAAAAGTVFPPIGIAILAAVGAGLLITGIALAAIAIQHHRQQKQFEFGRSAFLSMATGRPQY